MDDMQRDFKGVWIPREVWLDKRLNALDKMILTEIDSLDQGDRGCYASNKYLAQFCQCSETKVSKAISKLIELGYLYVQHFDGRTRELKSSLAFFARQECKKDEAAVHNVQDINIDIKPVTNTDKEKRKRFIPPTLQEVSEYCRERRNNVNPETFIDFYTAKGWKVGSQPMKDWKAAVRTWEKRNSGYQQPKRAYVPTDKTAWPDF